jgi:alcohol dehydrogenase class IV
MNHHLAMLSLYGGISISHCRTGLIHTLSVAFAKYIPLPHGLLNAAMVKYAVNHHLTHYQGLLARTMNSALQKHYSTDQEAYTDLQQWIDQIIHHLGRPIIFNEVPDPERIVNRLMQDKGLPGVSHGPINEEQLRKIVNQIIDENRS